MEGSLGVGAIGRLQTGTWQECLWGDIGTLSGNSTKHAM